MEGKVVTLGTQQLAQESYLNQILILLIGVKNDFAFPNASNFR